MAKYFDVASMLTPEERTTLTSSLNIDHVGNSDIFQYTTLYKMWRLVIKDMTGSDVCCADYDAYVKAKGLYSAIAAADEYVKRLLNLTKDQPVYLRADSSIWYGMLYAACQKAGKIATLDGVTIALRLFRFPKRFTPIEGAGLAAETYNKFRQSVESTRAINRDWWHRFPGPTVCQFARRAMRDMLIPDNFDSIMSYLPAMLRGKFSNGSTTDGGTSLGWKFHQHIRHGSLYYSGSNDYQHLLTRDHTVDVPRVGGPQVVNLRMVPKDFTQFRMIAPEPCYLNWYGGMVRELLFTLTKMTGAYQSLDPREQGWNQKLAAEGSVPSDDPWCTLDLSSASDSISRDLFFWICPIELAHLIRLGLSDRMRYIGPGPEGRDVGWECNTPMLATSGSPLTPFLESAFFLTILWVACDLNEAPREYARVYNDDICVRRSVCATAIELLQSFGLTVNVKKSYFSGYFRESCGKEYYLGHEVSGLYWPRHAISYGKGNDGDGEAVANLCDLQHKFYHLPNVRTFLTSLVYNMFPKMTISPVGTECDDLWASFVTEGESMFLPHYKRVVKYRPKLSDEFKGKLIVLDLPAYCTGITPFIHFPVDRKPPRDGVYAAQMYAYYTFLEKGPVYASDLDRLLGISVPNTAIHHLDEDAVMVWRKVNPPYLVEEDPCGR